MQLKDRKVLFDDGSYYNTGSAGYIEHYDFSRANVDKESRVKAVSMVASVCYGNKGLKPNFKLYDKLERESIGLPSSSFEFVPVFIRADVFKKLFKHFDKASWANKGQFKDPVLNTVRYGLLFEDKNIGIRGVLTNLRALLYDIEFIKSVLGVDDDVVDIENDSYFNTDEKEIEMIKSYFNVFKIRATIRDFRQLLRTRRASYQELSRRYTNGDKVKFEFRYNINMVKELPDLIKEDEERVEDYFYLLDKGIKAEDARDMLPVSLYSELWCAFYLDGFDNFINLRIKSSAQKGIREIAQNMNILVKST